jgi:hypothetical protein
VATVTAYLASPAVPRGSTLFATAMELYARHGGSSEGPCNVCGTRRCPVRPNAASVILAAGINPRHYDPPTRWGGVTARFTDGCERPMSRCTAGAGRTTGTEIWACERGRQR